jgi:exonuclease III
MGTQINVLQWNANGLSAHGPQLGHYLGSFRQLPDIICVQETKFKNKNKYRINGYTCERHDREPSDGGGGVATYIRQGINYEVLNKTTSPEILEIRIKTNEGTLDIINIYHPPPKKHKKEQEDQPESPGPPPYNYEDLLTS